MTNVVAVVYANYEEHPLELTLQILNRYKMEGKIKHIVVVNDGSKDKTELVSRRAGAVVINHKTNLGKREAFISGAMEAKKLGAEVMLSLDADITRFPRETFEQMIKTVTTGKKLMAIAQQYELRTFDKLSDKSRVEDPHSNAQRAINMDALEPLFKEKSKWLNALKIINPSTYQEYFFGTYRWGLEYALDKLIPKNKIARLDAPIVTMPAFRKGGQQLRYSQKGARKLVQETFDLRNLKAQQIRAGRKNRKLSLPISHK
ncbi:MAG: glycosyltransferase [archaeon]|jgi:glycosyltransferase involved in cell wall biosynthesis